jgi:hypothetical protein
MGAEGTLIHHAARSIRPLMIAMIESAFRTLLMAPARRTNRRVTPGRAAWWRTVGVSAIARRADPKGPGARPTHADTNRWLHEAAARSARPRRSAAVWENEDDWIRPAAASSRSRGPGGRTPGPHASLSRVTPYRSPRTFLASPGCLTRLTTTKFRVSDRPLVNSSTRVRNLHGGSQRAVIWRSLSAGGPLSTSRPGSILTSAEGLPRTSRTGPREPSAPPATHRLETHRLPSATPEARSTETSGGSSPAAGSAGFSLVCVRRFNAPREAPSAAVPRFASPSSVSRRFCRRDRGRRRLAFP